MERSKKKESGVNNNDNINDEKYICKRLQDIKYQDNKYIKELPGLNDK